MIFKIKTGISLGISLALSGSSLLAQTNNASPAPQVPQEGLRIFVCGHSLHTYIWYPLWELARAAGLKDNGRWPGQYLGGSTVLRQWELPDDKNGAKQHLLKGEVDVLTLSPLPFPDAGIDHFVKLGLEHNPHMRFTVQLSWSMYERDNQKIFAGPDPTYIADRNKTPAKLQELAAPNIKAGEEQIEKLNQEIGHPVVFLVPASQAVVALRSRIYNKAMPGLETQDQLFVDVNGHPTAPLQALNTYLHYAVIYRRSPVGLPMVGALKNVNNPAWDDKFNRSLQELAWETVTNYPDSGVSEALK